MRISDAKAARLPRNPTDVSSIKRLDSRAAKPEAAAAKNGDGKMSREEAGRKGGEARARQRQRGTNDNPAYLRRGFSWRGLKFSHAKDPPSYPIFKRRLRLPDRERVVAFV